MKKSLKENINPVNITDDSEMGKSFDSLVAQNLSQHIDETNFRPRDEDDKYGRDNKFKLRQMAVLIRRKGVLRNKYINLYRKYKDLLGYHYNEILQAIIFLNDVIPNEELYREYESIFIKGDEKTKIPISEDQDIDLNQNSPEIFKKRIKTGHNQYIISTEMNENNEPIVTITDETENLIETTDSASVGAYATKASWKPNGQLPKKGSSNAYPNGTIVQDIKSEDDLIGESVFDSNMITDFPLLNKSLKEYITELNEVAKSDAKWEKTLSQANVSSIHKQNAKNTKTDFDKHFKANNLDVPDEAGSGIKYDYDKDSLDIDDIPKVNLTEEDKEDLMNNYFDYGRGMESIDYDYGNKDEHIEDNLAKIGGSDGKKALKRVKDRIEKYYLYQRRQTPAGFMEYLFDKERVRESKSIISKKAKPVTAFDINENIHEFNLVDTEVLTINMLGENIEEVYIKMLNENINSDGAVEFILENDFYIDKNTKKYYYFPNKERISEHLKKGWANMLKYKRSNKR